jgi:hypothetical protein
LHLPVHFILAIILSFASGARLKAPIEPFLSIRIAFFRAISNKRFLSILSPDLERLRPREYDLKTHKKNAFE